MFLNRCSLTAGMGDKHPVAINFGKSLPRLLWADSDDTSATKNVHLIKAPKSSHPQAIWLSDTLLKEHQPQLPNQRLPDDLVCILGA
ncbi:hypothetical protein RA20_01195 [Leisingera sp. ANG-Vp]|nr:hypothetical protein RA20_01195 [Leisingera sp. ANG-Vp]